MKKNFRRIIHTVPGISEEAGGPSYSVVRLCESLVAGGEAVKWLRWIGHRWIRHHHF